MADRVRVFEPHDLPPGRTVDSFRFVVDFVWDGGVVDRYLTDDPQERDRLVRAAVDQQYETRVSGRG